MKRFIIVFAALILASTSCYSQQLSLEKETKYQKQVMETGYRILNANRVDKRMTFYYAPDKKVQAVTNTRVKQIALYKGMLPFLDSEDEIAAILAHEISNGLEAHKGLCRRIATHIKSKTYELKSDKAGVDLMVNAGYNPVAMIVVLNKITAEPNWFEKSLNHAEGSRRLLQIYDYIYSKYPEYLVDNEYLNNVYYQNFLLTTKVQRKQIRDKHLKNANKKTL